MNTAVELHDDYPQVTLTLKSSRGSGRLTLSRGLWSDREVESYDADLRADGVSASAGVYSYGTDGLPSFFDDLAENWRGWRGVETWGSLEGQLTIDADHDGLGTVTLHIGLTPSAALDRWSAMAVLTLDAGALNAVASSVHRFFDDAVATGR